MTTELTDAQAKTAVAQVNAKAEEQLEKLRKRREVASHCLSLASAEIERINERATQTAQKLFETRDRLKSAQADEERVKKYAEMATGTLSESSSIREWYETQKAVVDLQKTLSRQEQLASQESLQDNQRMAELNKQIEQEEATSSQTQAEIAKVEEVRVQAMAALGEQSYREVVVGLKQREEAIQVLRTQLAGALLDLEKWVSDSLLLLNAWPGYCEKVRELFPPVNDETSRIMRSALAYMDALLNDRRGLKMYLPESPETVHMPRWHELLNVGNDVFYGMQSISASGEHQPLQNKRERLAKVLEDYEQAHR